MKKIIKMALAAAMVFVTGATAIAQDPLEDPRYGDTREKREQNARKVSWLQGEYRSKNWDDAAVYVRELMNDAPLAPNLYLWGATIYTNKAARAKSVAEKQVYIDSVVLIYDRRVHHMGDHPTQGTPYILARKARDYVVLNPMDRSGVRRFYREAVDAGRQTDVALEYFQQLVNDYKGVEIRSEELLAEYERLVPIMENAEEAQKESFIGLFATSGAASCYVLEEIYTEALAGDPDNVDLLSKAYNLMSMIDCQSDFYINVAEKYYAASPSSGVAIRLASVFEGRQEFSKALTYLKEMLETETDPLAKAGLYLRVAYSELGLNHGSAAAQAAKAAISLDPSNGYAHYALAGAYAIGSSACEDFHARTVFWLAYDEYEKARLAFGDNIQWVEKAEAGKASSRANFPAFSDGIYYVEDYENGKSYTVSCGWVSGVTTIRSK